MSIFKDFRDFLKERYENNESKNEISKKSVSEETYDLMIYIL